MFLLILLISLSINIVDHCWNSGDKELGNTKVFSSSYFRLSMVLFWRTDEIAVRFGLFVIYLSDNEFLNDISTMLIELLNKAMKYFCVDYSAELGNSNVLHVYSLFSLSLFRSLSPWEGRIRHKDKCIWGKGCWVAYIHHCKRNVFSLELFWVP